MNCSFDDSILFMTSLINNMLSVHVTQEDVNGINCVHVTTCISCSIIGVDFSLSSRKTCPLWEQSFDELYIKPFTKVMI